MAGASELWPEHLANIKLVALDFDKTLTVRHTRGAVFSMAGLEEAELRRNMADIAFLQQIVPVIVERGCLVCIATFADSEEEALLSGKELVRKYLEVAFPGQSEKLIPDAQIEAWNPENKDMDMKATGKNIHLDNLRKRVGKGIKKSQMVLFDDSDRNCIMAKSNGYRAQLVEPPKPPGEEEAETFVSKDQGFCKGVWMEFVAAAKNYKDGGCVLS